MPPEDTPVADIAEEARAKEEVRKVVGGIGGKPRLKSKLLNAAFVVAVLGAFTMSLVTRGVSRIVFIDVGLLFLSLKLAYHLHTEAKVNHAQFWILATLEDRLLNVISELRSLRAELLENSRITKNDSSSEDTSDPPAEPAEKDHGVGHAAPSRFALESNDGSASESPAANSKVRGHPEGA